NSQSIGNILARTYDGGGIIGAVCHGPAAFIGAKRADVSALVHGKQLTSFSNQEEIEVKKDKIVPFLLESKLEEEGAIYSNEDLFQKHVVQDGRLITGQNPASAVGISDAMIHLLKKDNDI